MSKWTSLRDSTLGLLGAVAPTLAKTLGGPLAGTAVAALSKVLLGKSDGTTQEIGAALATASPEVIAAIRKADQDFEAEMGRQGIDLAKINATDRDSARQREVNSHDPWTPRILAAIVVLSVLTGEGYAMTHSIPTGAEMLVGRILGTLDAALMCVLYYYFGSSAGSAVKTNIMGTK